jgi:curved DNA-binding protein CbpA
MVDYYRVLGVDPAADSAAIRKAYRLKALECHPDRGGSHEAMLALNEAWEILSDPDLRRRYDGARGATADPSARAAASADAGEARRRAGHYPARWADFEAWLDGVAGDFADARHGSAGFFGEVRLPTVDNSLSGCLFIAAGAILAGVFISTALAAFCKEAKLKGPIALALIVGPVIGGAWAGSAAHQWIGAEVRKAREKAAERERRKRDRNPAQAPPPPLPLEPRILACGKCGQKLRVPALPSELLVTCKSCGHQFPCPPP